MEKIPMYGEGRGGSSRLGQIPNFYQKFVLKAPLTNLGEYLGEKTWLLKKMKNVTYALEKALSDGSNYNLSCWFDFLYALGTRSIIFHYIALYGIVLYCIA